jgi:hypothetical protein
MHPKQFITFMIIPKWLAPEANDIYPSIVWVKKLDNKKNWLFQIMQVLWNWPVQPQKKKVNSVG